MVLEKVLLGQSYQFDPSNGIFSRESLISLALGCTAMYLTFDYSRSKDIIHEANREMSEFRLVGCDKAILERRKEKIKNTRPIGIMSFFAKRYTLKELEETLNSNEKPAIDVVKEILSGKRNY